MYFLQNAYWPMAGMILFAPDTVAGYPAIYQAPDFDRQWFSSSTILARYRMIECLITGRNALGQNGQFGSALNSVSFVENNITSPQNLNNLINDPNYADMIEFFSNKLELWIKETNDLGEVPESEIIAKSIKNDN